MRTMVLDWLSSFRGATFLFFFILNKIYINVFNSSTQCFFMFTRFSYIARGIEKGKPWVLKRTKTTHFGNPVFIPELLLAEINVGLLK